jgi:hypothetical protein
MDKFQKPSNSEYVNWCHYFKNRHPLLKENVNVIIVRVSETHYYSSMCYISFTHLLLATLFSSSDHRVCASANNVLGII